MERDLSIINRQAQSDPAALIREADGAYRDFIGGVCRRMIDQHKRLLLLAGPSGSGKTTTANMIADGIRKDGHTCHVISLDNFYREIDDPMYPRTPEGHRDLETYRALDLPMLRACLQKAADGEAFSVPIYDFKTGYYREETYDIEASDDGVIVVEGLHALNPEVTVGLSSERALKIFISVSTNLTVDGMRVLSGHKLRFVRRVVRDYLYRGAEASRTAALWNNVRRGEDLYLYPYRGEADVTADTFHAYEAGLMAPLAAKILTGEALLDDPYVKETAEAIQLAVPISEKLVPQDALMREFIQGGIYEHLY